MSSLIEKAAQRLEQLRQAGAVVEPPAPEAPPVAAPVAPAVSAAPVAPVAKPQPAPSLAPASRAPLPREPEPAARTVRLNLEALAANGYVTPQSPRTITADQYRVIKRPLLANATGKGAAPVANGNRIMVTSSMPGEGKSFTAINLAMSMATELDYRVLLVDADVARPSLQRVLGLPDGPGLLDVLVDPKVRMSDALLRTNVDKLSVMPSGTPHPRATELLASDAMTRLVEEMGQRYPDRIIIFDSPPLLPTTEARVLATHMGQIVLVVHAEKTLRAEVEHALATIEACPVKLLVLNQSRTHPDDAYGGYGSHGYGYGYGYAQAKPAGADLAAAASPP